MATKSAANFDVVEFLFRDHHGWLLRWIARRSGRAGADDVASEVFLRLLFLPYVGELREPRAMMTTIATRVLNEVRRCARLARAFEAELSFEDAGQAPSPEERLFVVESLRIIETILLQLGPKARVAFLLNRVDGVPQEEVARRLGVSTRTVERYVAQGLRLAVRGREEP